ncbi:hypothetical protein [Alienimonas chondri]|uniref:Integral membrane protein n=1 Tax=Alienimonas chondri TaxID=2681879 RepID=A0ABX1VDL0_9PLAN|nr:hypothetical protein [Alienimonas chondri]NNJ25789.1 hypothetical protein [Alienimonas chondri]
MSLWEGEPITVGIWSWWVVITVATIVFGLRGWRRGAPGGRWALLAGVLGLSVGLTPWAAGLGLFLSGWDGREISDAMTFSAYYVAPWFWAASQLAVVAAIATAWRAMDRKRAASPPPPPNEGEPRAGERNVV